MAVAAGPVIVVALVAYVLFGCGTPTATSASTLDVAIAVTVPVTIGGVGKLPPAMPPDTALRMSPPTTVFENQAAPFDCATYVNGLDYGWHDMGPAMEAYRVGALCRGWPQESIDRFAPFAYDVIVKESGGCWNTKGGDLYVEGTCDQYTRHGTAEDSGFGQATYSLYGPTGVTCKVLGLCSQAAIIASPWASILGSVIVPLEDSGRFGWCDYEGAPDYHDCSLIGRDDRPLP